MMTIDEHTVGAVWLEAVRGVLNSGTPSKDGDVPLLEILNLTCVVRKPQEHDALVESLISPALVERMFAKFNQVELLPKAHFSYAERLYAMDGIDQISWAITRLRTKPETKSATICLLIPGDKRSHLPCLSLLDFKVRSGLLRCTAFFRSQNIGTRHPCNSLAISRLMQTMSNELRVRPGPLILHIASAHVYEDDIEFCRSAVARGGSA